MKFDDSTSRRRDQNDFILIYGVPRAPESKIYENRAKKMRTLLHPPPLTAPMEFLSNTTMYAETLALWVPVRHWRVG